MSRIDVKPTVRVAALTPQLSGFLPFPDHRCKIETVTNANVDFCS
jgi:hypothetical protein